MNDNELSALAKRVESIEKSIVHLKGPQGDPPPDDIGHWRWDIARRLQELERWIFKLKSPIADPAPDAYLGHQSDFVRSRLAELVKFNPGWFTDPPPDDFLNVRVLDLIRRYRGGFTDPVPEDFAKLRLGDLLQRVPGGGISDPSPEDIGRLTRTELETQLHKIGAELVRLKSIERVMQDRIQQLEPGKKK